MKQKIQHELAAIDSLLRSPAFSLSVAASQDASYHSGIGEPIPPFLSAEEHSAVVTVSEKEERIATNLAGFYALESGIGLLCDRTREKPTVLLEKILADKPDTASVLLLNRFANATWKAGQPFRGLDRITRPSFRGANFLPAGEVKKDFFQIKTAAEKLLSSLQDLRDSSVDTQMQRIRDLLHSQAYAREMAAVMDAGYHGRKQPPSASEEDDTATIAKPVKDLKIATNLAGFYAVECCTNYLVTTRNLLPSAVLVSIVNGSISKEDKNLFSRFANATWKAGQPFRGLDRVERETFTPFYFLKEADIEKDWVQIKSAAARLLAALQV